MEGLAYPLCLLRCLVSNLQASTTAGTHPHKLFQNMVEGVSTVLLNKHIHHKGLSRGQAFKHPPSTNPEQLQLSAPSANASPKVRLACLSRWGYLDWSTSCTCRGV